MPHKGRLPAIKVLSGLHDTLILPDSDRLTNSPPLNKISAMFRTAGLVLLGCLALAGCREPKPVLTEQGDRPQVPVIPEKVPLDTPWKSYTNVGFAKESQLKDHFEKHCAEFNAATPNEYLKQAQLLRDRPLDGTILENVRRDQVICRFNKSDGSFLAFNSNRTIRTFFKPNDGERYFYKQLDKSH